jgi:NTE family protein
MQRFELAIVGGGLTAARAIASYREAGGEGGIALFSDDEAPPYHRPPLSKGYLRGEMEQPPFVEEEAFYRDHDVEVFLETRVVELDPAERALVVGGGGRHGYAKLLLASGAKPRRLRVPGADLDGVFTLRTLADSDAIRAAAGSAERAVVVGAGFIGMEVAASLRELGVAVTLVHQGSGLFEHLGSDRLSAELADLYRAQGVELVLEDEVASFGGAGQLREAVTRSGVHVEADMAVVGIGVIPAVDFLDGSGLELDDGIVVDRALATGAPGVFAAGDVARFFDPLYGRSRRIEHWTNADYQGTEAGKLLAGRPGGFDHVSSFFTKIFGIGLGVFGDVADVDETASRGSLPDRDLVVAYGSGGRLVAALAVAAGDELQARLTRLIGERAPLSAAFAEDTAAAAGRDRA